MNALATSRPQQTGTALPAIFWGGLACGVLDITAAFVVYGHFERGRFPCYKALQRARWERGLVRVAWQLRG